MRVVILVRLWSFKMLGLKDDKHAWRLDASQTFEQMLKGFTRETTDYSDG